MKTLIIIILLLLVIGLYFKTEETKQVIGFVIKKLPKVSETLKEIRELKNTSGTNISVLNETINTTPPE